MARETERPWAAIRSLIELTEPRTKAASLVPFIFGVAWAAWRYRAFSPENTALFFASLLPVDLATTALNNAMDWRRSARSSVGRGEGPAGLSFRAAVAVTALLFCAGIAAGLSLAFRTDALVFFVGAAAVGVALAYSAGPLPISRTPFGELFSGVTMGAGIPFVATYVQFSIGSGAPVSLDLRWPLAALSVNLAEAGAIILASAPFAILIAGVMLANNIRDMEADRASGRLTLPLTVGRAAALRLFAALQASAFLVTLAAVALGCLPPFALAALLAAPQAARGTLRFLKSAPDAVPFGVSVGNLFRAGGLIALGTLVAAVSGASAFP